jgi:hypothetical protein
VCYTIPMLGKLAFEEDEGMEEIMNLMKKMLVGKFVGSRHLKDL